MEEIVALVLIFGGGALSVLAFSPVGRAIATRIQGGAAPPHGQLERWAEAHEALLDDLDQVRRDLADVQERLDFTERLVAQQREGGKLPGPGT